MTYTGTYTHPVAAVHLHAPGTGCTAHVQKTYTQTYTAYTRQGPTRVGGVLDTPNVCPSCPLEDQEGRNDHDGPPPSRRWESTTTPAHSPSFP
jgi:hypothetical protein